MANWQPIETAPKDGTPILGFAEGTMAVVYWFDALNDWYLTVSGEHATDSSWWPTHWMPLPDPPMEP